MSTNSDLVAEKLQPNSEIDKWYPIGENFWLRRTTDHNYLCVQVFPFMEHSFLCYLHVLDITEFEKKSAERYRLNVEYIPEELPDDIRYMYPIAFSQDTEKAREMFAAPTANEKMNGFTKWGLRCEVMIYACDSCRFIFEWIGQIDRCPDCGKKNIREADEEEKQEYSNYQKEKNKHSL